jgi:hypothetical protein
LPVPHPLQLALSSASRDIRPKPVAVRAVSRAGQRRCPVAVRVERDARIFEEAPSTDDGSTGEVKLPWRPISPNLKQTVRRCLSGPKDAHPSVAPATTDANVTPCGIVSQEQTEFADFCIDRHNRLGDYAAFKGCFTVTSFMAARP